MRLGRGDAQVDGERVECFVVVVQLDDNAHNGDEAEDVGAWVDDLVFPAKGELDCNTEAFDEHH
jgi:hypothetical protein